MVKVGEGQNSQENEILSVGDIVELLTFVRKTTYFSFRDSIYQQQFGVAMGSPVSPIVVNIFMEDLEQRAIATSPVECRPRIWKRFVDDTITAIPKGKAKALNEHLDTVDETGSVKFSHEEMEDHKLPFLDALFHIREDGGLKTTVYRKKTHTNQYLQFSSHHPLSHKLGVVRT